METIIVSRHPAAIEFIARELDAQVYRDHVTALVPGAHEWNVHGDIPPTYDIPVIAQATAADVRGKHVYGNLPMHLAALATQVTVVEFEGDPPRGAEYTLADMDAAGALLRTYRVDRDRTEAAEARLKAPTAAQIKADHAELRRLCGERRF